MKIYLNNCKINEINFNKKLKNNIVLNANNYNLNYYLI